MSLRNHTIYQHSRIKEILNYCHFNTCVLIDIDDTIATQALGDPWFVTLMGEACRRAPGKETTELVIAIYHAVQRVTQMQMIERDMGYIIQALQDIGVPVIALTSRGIPIVQSTLNQLHGIGVDFDRQWGRQQINLTIDGKSGLTTFKDGIIFCTGNDKGKCLSAFLNSIQYFPQHVLMVDDKETHLQSVQKTVLAYGGQFEGVRYGQMDKAVKQFDFAAAQKQLEKIKNKFPINDQKALEKVNNILASKAPDTFFKATAADVKTASDQVPSVQSMTENKVKM